MSAAGRGSVTVAVVATTPTLAAVDENLAAVDRALRAVSGAADLVILPELFATGYHLTDLDLRAVAEPLDGPVVTELCRQARAHATALIGSVVEAAGPVVYDTAVVVDRRGRLVGSYRKSHLHGSELDHFAAGDRLVVIELDGLRVGVAICVEHAYPEIFAELALQDAHLVAVPAAVRDGYGYLIDLRTRARAQDNQLFVATANFAGDDGHTAWCGGSAVVNPRGEVLATTAGAPGWALAELDLDQQLHQRRQEPILARRRPELYPRLRGLAGSNSSASREHVERTVQ